MPERLAIYPARDAPIGFFSWLRELVAGVAVRLWPGRFPGTAALSPQDHTVLLIPGFSSGDWAVTHLKHFLQRQGYRVYTAGIWYNPGPTPRLTRRLHAAFMRLSDNTKVMLIGISLGGMLARDLALRHPGRVRCVVTVCSPVRVPVITPLAPFAAVLAPFYAADWVARRHRIANPLPVPVTALHAVHDGVVLRDQCWLDDTGNARNVVVAGRHMTLECTPPGLAAVAEALAGCVIC